jgi:hypothetical protein
MGIETTIALQQKFETDTGNKCVMCSVQHVPVKKVELTAAMLITVTNRIE